MKQNHHKLLTHLQLQKIIRDSKTALADAAALKSEATVDMARALHVRKEAEKEIIETRNVNTKVQSWV